MDNMLDQDELQSPGHETLSLGQILLGTLPSTLLTASAPETYAVAAVFNRRPLDEEVRAITSPATQATLTAAGYPEVTLRVVNRRLEIHGSNLAELREGLAQCIGEILEEASNSIRQQRDKERNQLIEASRRELERVSAVRALTESVVFRPKRTSHEERLLIERSTELQRDRLQEETWDSEGGHA